MSETTQGLINAPDLSSSTLGGAEEIVKDFKANVYPERDIRFLSTLPIRQYQIVAGATVEAPRRVSQPLLG